MTDAKPVEHLDAVDALTADGGIVTIRPVDEGDRPALIRLYSEATPDSLRLRFFAYPGAATLAAEVDRLCLPETGQHLAMLAEEGGTVVGVVSCERTNPAGSRGEFATFVADGCRGRGIGTLVLEHLAARARRHGDDELVGEVLPGNIGMLRVARGLSAHVDGAAVGARGAIVLSAGFGESGPRGCGGSTSWCAWPEPTGSA